MFGGFQNAVNLFPDQRKLNSFFEGEVDQTVLPLPVGFRDSSSRRSRRWRMPRPAVSRHDRFCYRLQFGLMDLYSHSLCRLRETELTTYPNRQSEWLPCSFEMRLWRVYKFRRRTATQMNLLNGVCLIKGHSNENTYASTYLPILSNWQLTFDADSLVTIVRRQCRWQQTFYQLVNISLRNCFRYTRALLWTFSVRISFVKKHGAHPSPSQIQQQNSIWSIVYGATCRNIS